MNDMYKEIQSSIKLHCDKCKYSTKTQTYSCPTNKLITAGQYLNLMNFFGPAEIEMKRLRALCKKFDVPTAIQLPRSKYKEAMSYLRNNLWILDLEIDSSMPSPQEDWKNWKEQK